MDLKVELMLKNEMGADVGKEIGRRTFPGKALSAFEKVFAASARAAEAARPRTDRT